MGEVKTRPKIFWEVQLTDGRVANVAVWNSYGGGETISFSIHPDDKTFQGERVLVVRRLESGQWIKISKNSEYRQKSLD